MKKTRFGLLTILVLFLVSGLGAGARGNAAWLIGEDTVLTLPAELLKGYSEANSDMIDVDLSEWQYLHFDLCFAEDVHIEYPSFWGYIILIDNAGAVGQYESAKNVVSYNLAQTADYEAGKSYHFAVPLSGFAAYSPGSLGVGEWTEGLKMIRFVFASAENPEITVRNLYLSKNENDPAPSAEQADPQNPPTGMPALPVGAALLTSGAVLLRSKKRKG